MSPNQHESVARVARYARHVTELCEAFRVKLALHRRHVPPERAFAGLLALESTDAVVPFDERARIIYVPRVTCEITYVIPLHELGHLLSPLGQAHWRDGSAYMRKTGKPSDLRDVRLLLTAERAAWEWAKQMAFEWTEIMNANAHMAFDSYRQVGRRYGHKEEPLW